MSYFSKPGSHIRDKVNVVLELSNYATKKEVDHATGTDTSDLAPKNDLTALKSEVDKLDIKKMTNVTVSLNKNKSR